MVIEMIDYVGRNVKAILPNTFYYTGKCLKQEGDKILILDKNNKEVLLSISNLVVLEVLN